MRVKYKRVVLIGVFVFIFFVILDRLVSFGRVPGIESAQIPILEAHLAEPKIGPRGVDLLEDENFLPAAGEFWKWLPGMSKKRGQTDSPKISAMKKALGTLNGNKTAQDDTSLLSILRRFWIRPPSRKEYNLNDPDMKDFSKGQSAVVDKILDRKMGGFFVECGALDGETRSNTLFFERERGWSGLLIEAGPLNYRNLVRKHRKAYSTPACLGIQPYPTKMYFHRGRNRGRLIDGKEAFEWVRNQAMSVWLMEVQCFPIFSLLLSLNQTKVDYFSLDVEGVELDVLQTIPWNRVDIQVMTVEFAHNHQGKDALRKYVEGLGYETVTEVTRMDGLANDLVFKKISNDGIYKR